MSDDRASSQLGEVLEAVDPEELAQASASLDIARIVYLARTRRGLTQTEAAMETGLKQQAISRMEGGTLNVTIGTLERFLRKIGYALEVGLVDDRSGHIVEQLVLNDDRERATCREAARLVTSNGSSILTLMNNRDDASFSPDAYENCTNSRTFQGQRQAENQLKAIANHSFQSRRIHAVLGVDCLADLKLA